jgi:hypothetical protein
MQGLSSIARTDGIDFYGSGHCGCFGSAGAVDRDLKGSADLTHPGVGQSAKPADQHCD